MEQTLTVSYGAPGTDAAMARITTTRQQTWQEYMAVLTKPHVGPDKAQRGWSVPAKFSPAYRHGDNFVARYALTFDYDHVTPDDVETLNEAYMAIEYLAYTTHSHTEDKPRWRFVFPLSRPASHDEFQAVSRAVADYAGIELIAAESFKPSQMMFLPVVKAADAFSYRINSGTRVDVDAVLASYEDWTDRSSWPRRQEGDSVAEGDESVDPTKKPGIVGDFCRAYTCEEAIVAFDLPYEKVR